MLISSEEDLIRLAIALGAPNVGGKLSIAEQRMLNSAQTSAPLDKGLLVDTRDQIRAGEDPLGSWFYTLRTASERRAEGAIYTPPGLIDPMVQWTQSHSPARVVDAGSGSGRFIVAASRSLKDAHLIAVDLDPLATLMTRSALAVLDIENAEVLQKDFMKLKLPRVQGKTAFLGNPPYVRHHQLSAATKVWAQKIAKDLGHSMSGLAGLHAYFFLATATIGRPGDLGTFVTSAEWLDVNYGSIVRDLLLGKLGGEAVHVVEPEAMPFEGTATTAAITSFHIGTQPSSLRFRPVKSLTEIGDLSKTGDPIARQRVQETSRWSTLVRTRNKVPEGYIELGELCRVHRGTATGANRTWVAAGPVTLPDSVLYPSVTRAKELFAAGAILDNAAALKKVIDIPADLDIFEAADRQLIDRFIRAAKKAAVHEGYIASHRKAWWSVGLRKPAPILATYMARRPPAFVINSAEARHINIAHGLYPRVELPSRVLDRLAESLRYGVALSQGRTYAGGLTKFEPKEMERLPVPNLDSLYSYEPLNTTQMVS